MKHNGANWITWVITAITLAIAIISIIPFILMCFYGDAKQQYNFCREAILYRQ
jgi:hypothetical protein